MPARRENARRRFFLMSVTVALSLPGDSLLYAVLPARTEDFRVLVWQVGLLLGANRMVRLVTNELAGRAVRRFGSRGPLLAAIGLGSLTTAAYALPFGFWWLLAARMVWGVCWSVLRVEGQLAALEFSRRENRGRIFGAYQAITLAGSGGGVLAGGFLCDLWGIPPAFALFALLAAGGIALAAAALPGAPGSAGVPGVQAPAAGAPLFLWYCALVLTMVEEMIGNLTGRLVADRILPGLTGRSIVLGAASLTGLLLSVRYIQTLFLGPLGGLISDRFGRSRLLTAACGLQILLIAFLALGRTPGLAVFFLLLQFAAAVMARLLVFILAGDLAPPGQEPLFMSRFSTFVDLGTALGPVVAFSLYAGRGFGWVAALSVGLLVSVLLLLVAGGLQGRAAGRG